MPPADCEAGDVGKKRSVVKYGLDERITDQDSAKPDSTSAPEVPVQGLVCAFQTDNVSNLIAEGQHSVDDVSEAKDAKENNSPRCQLSSNGIA